MIKKVIMPKLGETMEEGIISKWLKKEGNKVEKGEPIFEVTTDKANFEVESTASGYLRKIICPAEPDKNIPVLQTVALMSDSMDEGIPEEEVEKSELERKEEKPAVKNVTAAVSSDTGTDVKSSPLAKKLAKEKGIDLSKITGTGPGGRITEKDVLSAVTTPVSAEAEIIPLKGMRKIIAQRLTQSKQSAPHYYLQSEIDMSEIVQLREKLSSGDERPSFNDFIIKACAKALEDNPQMNVHFDGTNIKVMKDINVGVAVAVKDGLIVPVIKQTNKKSIKEIMQKTKEIKEKAKNNKFTPEDLSGGTFTISNLGMYDIDTFIAIINPPEVGILAIGKIKESPVVQDGKIMAAQTMKVSLSADHRVVDGATGAQFLKRLKQILEVGSDLES
ncbi:MAG: hypothetical protein AUJ85_09175 [Elusimicrobia bacterium CG1_02_37_114]|nr:MAG: hypothetical protein AUJ85_09175 [Elusimicrobia bacterium CG1_02_37_114]